MQQNISNPFGRGTKLIRHQLDVHVSRVDRSYRTQGDYDSQRSLHEQVKSLKIELEEAKRGPSVGGEILRMVRKMEFDLKKTGEMLYLRTPPELDLGM